MEKIKTNEGYLTAPEIKIFSIEKSYIKHENNIINFVNTYSGTFVYHKFPGLVFINPIYLFVKSFEYHIGNSFPQALLFDPTTKTKWWVILQDEEKIKNICIKLNYSQ